jgi:hypothetical protein
MVVDACVHSLPAKEFTWNRAWLAHAALFNFGSGCLKSREAPMCITMQYGCGKYVDLKIAE